MIAAIWPPSPFPIPSRLLNRRLSQAVPISKMSTAMLQLYRAQARMHLMIPTLDMPRYTFPLQLCMTTRVRNRGVCLRRLWRLSHRNTP